MCVADQIAQKFNKIPILVFKVIQGYCFRRQLKVHVRRVLVANSNLSHILNRF